MQKRREERNEIKKLNTKPLIDAVNEKRKQSIEPKDLPF